MIIWINKAKPFEAGVIVRFLYYATGLDEVDLYITGLKKLGSFVRYSRIPVRVVKNRINFFTPKGKFLIVSPDGKDISNLDVSKYSGFLVDFSGNINGEKVKGLGLKLLHYEAISLFSKIFLVPEKEEKIRILKGDNDIRDKIYFAKKILEGIKFIDNYYIVSPRLLLFCLRNFEKKFNILVDEDGTEIKLNNEVIEKVHIKFYNSSLEEIGEDFIILRNNLLEIPIMVGKKKKRLRFYIDFNRRRVYITNKFYLSNKELLPSNETIKNLRYL